MNAKTVLLCAVVLSCRLAYGNEITIVQVTTTEYTVTTERTTCLDWAKVTMPLMSPSEQSNGHPSRARLVAPRDERGVPWAMGDGYGNGCPKPRKWTAWIARAGVPNPYMPVTAEAKAGKVVVKVTSRVTTTTVAILHIILSPEQPLVCYDLGVTGSIDISYAITEEVLGDLFRLNVSFDGSEFGQGNIEKNGTHWVEVPGPVYAKGAGEFDRAFRMTDSAIDVLVPVTLGANEDRTLNITFEGSTHGAGPQGPSTGQFGVTTNSLPCSETPDGDMNGDGFVDGDDVRLFVVAALNGSTDPLVVCRGDLNGDNHVDPLDVPGFVGSLLDSP